MKAVKRAWCPVCKYTKNTTETKINKAGESTTLKCPKDGTPLKLSVDWYVRGVHNGESIYKSCGPKKVDADDFIAACRMAKRTGTVLPGQEKDIEWEDVKKNCEGWWDIALENKSINQRTRDHYKYQCLLLDKFFFGTTLLTITKLSVEKFMVELGKTHSPASVAHATKALKRMYKMHIENLDLETDARPKLIEKAFIIEKIKLPPVDNEITVSGTETDLQSVLKEIEQGKGKGGDKQRLTLAILLGVGMLMRPTNVNSLEWSEVDLVNGIITIPKEKMKGKKEFKQAIPEQVLDALKKWKIKNAFKSKWVFPSPKDSNKHIGSMGKAMRHRIKNAGINADDADRQSKITYYVLTRHTGATQLYEESGENLEMVSKAACHADSRITKKRYVKDRLEYSKKTVLPLQEKMLKRMTGK